MDDSCDSPSAPNAFFTDLRLLKGGSVYNYHHNCDFGYISSHTHRLNHVDCSFIENSTVSQWRDEDGDLIKFPTCTFDDRISKYIKE